VPIPTYDELMLPVLKLCAQQIWGMKHLVEKIADELHLTEDERREMIPSGGSTVIGSRVAWAKTYLKQAGLVEQPKRAMVTITPRGRDVLARNPSKIDGSLLMEFEEFRAFVSRTKSENALPKSVTDAGQRPEPPVSVMETTSTPEEQITSAALTLDEALRDALITRILEANPTFFERLIIDLLVKMGYGGSRTDAGEHLGGTGDGGVDGVIREDQLGLDRVFLQAKRYQPGNTVGSEAVHAFMGALLSKGAQKGVLITTSSFSKAALNVAANQVGHVRMVLIDGRELTRLMIRFGVGVRAARTVEIKRIDPAYFEDAEPE